MIIIEKFSIKHQITECFKSLDNLDVELFGNTILTIEPERDTVCIFERILWYLDKIRTIQWNTIMAKNNFTCVLHIMGWYVFLHRNLGYTKPTVDDVVCDMIDNEMVMKYSINIVYNRIYKLLYILSLFSPKQYPRPPERTRLLKPQRLYCPIRHLYVSNSIIIRVKIQPRSCK